MLHSFVTVEAAVDKRERIVGETIKLVTEKSPKIRQSRSSWINGWPASAGRLRTRLSFITNRLFDIAAGR
jgi:hypothetical protein